MSLRTGSATLPACGDGCRRRCGWHQLPNPLILAHHRVLKPADDSTAPPQMNKPSRGSLLLALIPFVAMCFSVPLWDRATPLLLGLPFNLCWLIAWIVLSSLCLAIIYRIEARRAARAPP